MKRTEDMRTKQLTTDEELLQHFFDSQRQHIPDNGFTQRVMLAITTTASLSAQEGEEESECASIDLNHALDIFTAVAIVPLFIYLSIEAFAIMDIASPHMFAAIIRDLTSFLSPSNLLVQFMLFLHHLPSILPSPAQMLAIIITSLVLLFTALQVPSFIHRS